MTVVDVDPPGVVNGALVEIVVVVVVIVEVAEDDTLPGSLKDLYVSLLDHGHSQRAEVYSQK